MVGLRKLNLPKVDFADARQFAQSALNAARDGKLGYTLICANREGREAGA